MKVIAALLLSVSLVGSSAFAQATLPPQVQADILVQRIEQSMAGGRVNDALAAINAYKGLGISIPPALLYYEGQLSAMSNDFARSEIALETYLSKANNQDRNYSKAISLYADVSKRLNAESLTKVPKDKKELVSILLRRHNSASQGEVADAERRVLVEIGRYYVSGSFNESLINDLTDDDKWHYSRQIASILYHRGDRDKSRKFEDSALQIARSDQNDFRKLNRLIFIANDVIDRDLIRSRGLFSEVNTYLRNIPKLTVVDHQHLISKSIGYQFADDKAGATVSVSEFKTLSRMMVQDQRPVIEIAYGVGLARIGDVAGAKAIYRTHSRRSPQPFGFYGLKVVIIEAEIEAFKIDEAWQFDQSSTPNMFEMAAKSLWDRESPFASSAMRKISEGSPNQFILADYYMKEGKSDKAVSMAMLELASTADTLKKRIEIESKPQKTTSEELELMCVSGGDYCIDWDNAKQSLLILTKVGRISDAKNYLSLMRSPKKTYESLGVDWCTQASYDLVKVNKLKESLDFIEENCPASEKAKAYRDLWYTLALRKDN